MTPSDCLYIKKIGPKFFVIVRPAGGSEIIKSEHADRVSALRAMHELYRAEVIRPSVMAHKGPGFREGEEAES